jgi:hypothetical protein
MLAMSRLVVLASLVSRVAIAATAGSALASAGAQDPAAAAAPRHAYFGNVHVHTGYSFDAFTNGTLTTPSSAYDWAQGKPIPGSKSGPQLKIRRPLDFYAVSDHAEYMGVFRLMADPDDPLSKLEIAKGVTSSDPNVALRTFAQLLRDMSAGKVDPQLVDPKVSRSVWQEIVKVADQYYRPGRFTTFPAFEWTSNPNKRNLHRVVVFRDSKVVPDLVMSSFDSEKPEDLWKWMAQQRGRGSKLLAIPHNANASDGLMFAGVDTFGKPFDEAYVRERSANEPLYAITQIKGTSETHPALSPNDEFAAFEQWDYTLSADAERPTHRVGSFARRALLDGLALAAQGKGNPYQFGFIGDSDTHNAAASNEEDNYTGKFAMEVEPAHRLNGLPGQPAAQLQQVREVSSGGLGGVWAEANTREAIFDAMLRRETFGTSGSHITVRFFGGWDFQSSDAGSADLAKVGYPRGVPMGGELNGAKGKAPSFIVAAMKDPGSGNLDRIQIVKGWVDAGGAEHDTIYEVVWSGDRKPDAHGRLPAVGNTVDAAKATYDNSIGAAQLAAAWTDPEFEASRHAFYYARVVEIPTPRWSTRDAVALGVEIPKGLPASIQERAWSSPIWYTP